TPAAPDAMAAPAADAVKKDATTTAAPAADAAKTEATAPAKEETKAVTKHHKHHKKHKAETKKDESGVKTDAAPATEAPAAPATETPAQ
ncbi:MAG: hypothetical protein P4L72_05445, partial [Parvibaculum sp.]|nr:hypothetical protein [Parvibaculum sp.]